MVEKGGIPLGDDIGTDDPLCDVSGKIVRISPENEDELLGDGSKTADVVSLDENV